MWTAKKTAAARTYPFPGEEQALDGLGAVYAVEITAGEVILLQAGPDLSEITGPLGNLTPRSDEVAARKPALIREIPRTQPLARVMVGYALGGLRTCMLTGSLDENPGTLHAVAGKRLPCVVHLTCRALPRQAGSLHGGHDDYYAAAPAGFFQLFARNAQEAADFALIAHRIAERSLTPGICAQDMYRTAHSVQNIRLPEYELVQAYLGHPDDLIPTPTPAQAILFGERRRRIPLLIDRDHPAGIGGVQDHDSYFKALAAQRPFFAEHVDTVVDEAMSEFGRLTGRVYNKVTGYRTDDAEVVVIAQGAVVEELEVVADYMRAEEKLKAGVIGLSVYRPFPGPQLTRMLKGKKVVTVLERTDQPLAEDLPAVREVRSAIDKAVENGRRNGDPPDYPAYETYRRLDEHPRVLSGVCATGGDAPSFAELVAVFRNMRPAGTAKKLFYAGIGFDPETRDFPHLQTQQQRIRKDYPHLDDLSLAACEGVEAPLPAGRSVRLYALSGQGGLFAGNLFARSLSTALDWRVRTFPSGGLAPDLQPVSFSLCHTDGDDVFKHAPDVVDTVLVSGDKLLDALPSHAALKKGGTLVVETNRRPETLWSGMSARNIDWVRGHDLRVYAVDARKIASDAASQPSFVDQLAVWALLGAYLATLPGAPTHAVDRIVEDMETRLQRVFGAGHFLVGDITNAIRGGGREVVELDRPAGDARTGGEPDAPWTVRDLDPGDGTVFDATRFWHSVGYLYDTGQVDRTLTDPYVASGIIPARSSAYRNMAAYRLGIPRLLAENCTGCGLCWAHCPDSALPATVRSIDAVIDTAVTVCGEGGTAMIQMQRVGAQLAKMAYRLVSKDDLKRYLSFGPLLDEAFSQLVKRMDLPADKLAPLSAEFQQVRSIAEHFPVIRTETFFNGPHKREKGSGEVLSIAINPLSCKGCRLCVEVCPENAFEWTAGTAGELEPYHRNWQFLMKLPDLPAGRPEQYVSPDEPDTEVYRLLDKAAYHSLVGGDGAYPGNSVKTAVHLVTAAVESVMRPRFRNHIDRLTRLIKGVEDKIQGEVSGAVKINDFDAFSRQLRRLGAESLTAESLSDMIGAEEGAADIDAAQMKRLSDLLTDLQEQRRLYLQGAVGDGRASMVMTIDAAVASMWSGTYPSNPHAHPWVSHRPGDAPALAEGVFESIARRLAKEIAVCRRADLELSDSYVPAEHDSLFAKFDWKDFADEERQLMPVVLVLCQSESTGFDDISDLLSGPYPIKVVVVNTEGLTVPETSAVQGPGAASPATAGYGNRAVGGGKSDLAERALGCGEAFVLQASVGHPGHLIRGVCDGIARPRPALFHIYAPDAPAHGIAPEKTAEQADLAFRSRVFPLFERDPDEQRITLQQNPDPERDWSSIDLTVSETSGSVSVITVPVTAADWAVGEMRFHKHFKVISKGYLSDNTVTLSRYLDLEPDAREGLEPYIDVSDHKQRHRLAVVSPELVRAVEERRSAWRRLQRLAAASTEVPAGEAASTKVAVGEVADTGRPEPERTPQQDRSTYDKLTERLLWLCGYGRDPEFFKQSLREFVMQEKSNRNGEQQDDEDVSPRSTPGGS